jgi:glycosyltransferase involved in cell wall biosynthesis
LRCLHICETINLRHGGVSRSVIDLVSAVYAKGIDVSLASAELGSQDGGIGELPRGLPVHDLSSKTKFDLKTIDLIEQADVVHLHTPWWPQNRSLVRTARRLNKPVVLSSHGMLDDWSMQQKALKKSIYMMLFGKRMLRNCRVHCTAEAEKDQVLKRAKPLAVDVIPLVIDERYFSQIPDKESALAKWPFLKDTRTQKLLFLGRVDPKKGLDVAIKALAKLPNATLSVAGPGEESYVSELRGLGTKLGVADRVRWLGGVYNQEKESLLAACDCMVLPTQQENFGLVLVEGLAMGIQVVTTRGTDIWQEIQRCGGVIVERTPDAFARGIASCFTGEGDNSTNRLESQRRLLRDWLDPKPTVDLYIKMYQECVNSEVRRKA